MFYQHPDVSPPTCSSFIGRNVFLNRRRVTFIIRTIVLLIPITTTAWSCRKETPPEPPGPNPGKRNYVWSIDTLAYPGSFQTNMRSMYATSSDNVYIVGHNDINRGKMYRYNGQQWSPVILTASEGGPIQGAIDLTAIHGSGPNDIWAVGEDTYYDPLTGRFSDSSLIIHFDGTLWRKINMSKRRSLWCVWVFSPTQVYAGGADGILYRYDGAQWTIFELGREFFFSSITGISATQVYAMGHRNDAVPPVDSSGSFLFRFNGESWTIIDSVMFTPGAPPQHFGLRLTSHDGSVYSSGPNIYKHESGVWTKLFDGPVATFSATGFNNIIAVGESVFHFNGQDWYEYLQFRSSDGGYWDCYISVEEVFVVGTNGFISFILHGK